MLKICYIISGDLWAGAEVMAYQLIKGLIKCDDLEILVILFNEGRLANELRNLGIRVEIVEENKVSFWDIRRSVQGLLRQYLPDVIHTHGYKENILAYWCSRFSKGIKLVATQHGMPETFTGFSSLKHKGVLKYNFYILWRHFDKVVVVSNDIAKHFVNNFRFNKTKVQVIHNGIEIPEHSIQRNSTNTFVIGSCGRLFPVKDYPLMIRVAKRISDNNNIRFELAGDGPEMKRLRDLINQFGLNRRFILRGHLDNIDEFYRGLDLFINTSIHEGIPMSVLEAMSYGLPVVAPRVGGLKEIIEDGIDGYLIEKRDPSVFSRRCVELWKNRNLWKRMRYAAMEKVSRYFSLESMAQRYYETYLRVQNCC